MTLPNRPARLLAEMARRRGVADVSGDVRDLETVFFRRFDITINYRGVRDVFRFSAPLGPDAPQLDRPGVNGGSMQRRQPRLHIFRPKDGEPTAFAELSLTDLADQGFEDALEDFLDAVCALRAGIPAGVQFSLNADLPSDDTIWIRL